MNANFQMQIQELDECKADFEKTVAKQNTRVVQQILGLESIKLFEMNPSSKEGSVELAANAHKALKWLFQNSLGAMTVTTSFMTQLEQTQMQGINKWWYKKGVGRVQVKIDF